LSCHHQHQQAIDTTWRTPHSLQIAPAKRRWGGGCWDEEQLRAIRHDTIGISGEELALKDADKFRTPWKQLQRSGGKKAAVGIEMESCHHSHQH